MLVDRQNQWVDAMWGTRGVHDPTIVKEGKQYYLFSTDTKINGKLTQGIQIRESRDFKHWRYIGTALGQVPTPAKSWSHANGLWAPDVIKVGVEYRMYYAASTLGSRISCIGLATAPHLQGPWTDKGLVIKTDGKHYGQNAIDANIVTGKDGRQWLLYGSFFGGIFLVELDPVTGLVKYRGDYGQRIAQRPSQAQDGAIEGCFIHYQAEQDCYYLFMSYDSLTWSYNVRVARSKMITGPYLDYNGQNVCYPSGTNYNFIGTKILGSYSFMDGFSWVAPGHNSVFTENNQDFMVHHVRCQPDQQDSYGIIRKIYWLANGWPVIDPNYYTDAESNHEVLKESKQAGAGEIIYWPSTSELIPSHRIVLDQAFYDTLADYCIIISRDWETGVVAKYLIGLSKSGTGLWVRLTDRAPKLV
ncbi:arabinan endo-1,5-alpha-L-arabinosidase [Lapidilactobacillus luobeiensis]|uniref:arabinan endo-1,5-alpha-L-arabinosidase n=1 Tax=Lapidilactobacillus luobeiensis TaxID=2950371 RepID=UPI0021C2F7E7|nr:arabinan endo-1,5-alpha-L-arabinosidase [Lapidilactobacillus luobeiensis]